MRDQKNVVTDMYQTEGNLKELLHMMLSSNLKLHRGKLLEIVIISAGMFPFRVKQLMMFHLNLMKFKEIQLQIVIMSVHAMP